MKAYIKKNKFFVSLLTLACIIILSLSVVIFQKSFSNTPVEGPSGVDEGETTNEEPQISALSGSFNRQSTGNIMTISWGYMENNSKVTSTYLYLNNNEGINVTQNRYYDFPQSIYDYPSGDNKVRLVLNLENGKQVEKEIIVFVDYILRAKQEVIIENNVVKLVLEYVYDVDRPVNDPEILITAMPDKNPSVGFVDTQTTQQGTRIVARSTFMFVWNTEAEIPKKWSVRWKFNEIPDSFDFNVVKPVNKPVL